MLRVRPNSAPGRCVVRSAACCAPRRNGTEILRDRIDADEHRQCMASQQRGCKANETLAISVHNPEVQHPIAGQVKLMIAVAAILALSLSHGPTERDLNFN